MSVILKEVKHGLLARSEGKTKSGRSFSAITPAACSLLQELFKIQQNLTKLNRSEGNGGLLFSAAQGPGGVWDRNRGSRRQGRKRKKVPGLTGNARQVF